jgi:hypothetical protein
MGGRPPSPHTKNPYTRTDTYWRAHTTMTSQAVKLYNGATHEFTRQLFSTAEPWFSTCQFYHQYWSSKDSTSGADCSICLLCMETTSENQLDATRILLETCTHLPATAEAILIIWFKLANIFNLRDPGVVPLRDIHNILCYAHAPI